MEKLSTGTKIFDELLDGGYERDVITTIYGPSGSGKTNVCMISAINMAAKGKKVLYVDTEGGFSVERLKQLCIDPIKILNRIFLIKPTNFKEQKDVFRKLKDNVTKDVGAIIVDTMTMHYRVELGKIEMNGNVYETNAALGEQMSNLIEIARKRKIPIIITNQVYSDFGNREKIKMVGGDILKYGSKCLIELQTGHRGLRKAILKKHRSIADGKEILFRIVNEGIVKED